MFALRDRLPAPVRTTLLSLFSVAVSLAAFHPVQAQNPTFTDTTLSAGFNYAHGFTGLSDGWPMAENPQRISGGVAAGDYDRDGWIDLYVVRGDIGANLLFRNLGDGTFQELGGFAGVAVSGEAGSGPALADIDGDGWPDLLINGVQGTQPRLFRNLADGTFGEITVSSGLSLNRDGFSAAFGDYDRDGDLDLLQTHWELPVPCTPPCAAHLWQNDGQGVFTDVGTAAGIIYTNEDKTFTPNFADINNDGFPDVLMASDFGTTRVYLNDGDGTFTDVSDPMVLTDEAGMGSAVGDYDNDGDLDWFISSVFDAPPVGVGVLTGNRLYRNNGSGVFQEVSAAAGVRIGYWGWGSCFADIDNDGHLDIFHVNGWSHLVLGGDFSADPSRLFMSDGDGTFTERSADFGLNDTGQGRGVVCFDYDRDGDIDLFVANNNQAPAFYRNDGGNQNNFLNVRLSRPNGGRTVIGSRILVTTGATTQMREVRAGSNFLSQNPEEVHFGLGMETTVAELRIEWPEGLVDTYQNVAVNQFLELAPATVFADGFESGDVSAWSSAAGTSLRGASR